MKMKNTIIGLLVSVASVSLSHAATLITAFNAAGGSWAQQVLLSTGSPGTPYTAGQVMIGTFTTTTGLGSASGPINLANYGWSELGATAFSALAGDKGIFGTLGGTGVTGTLPTTVTGPFIGNDIFAVVANPAGDNYIIWDSGIKFAVEQAGIGGAAVSFATRDSTLVRGALVPLGNTGLTGALAGQNGVGNAVTFVPESSTALLGALGGLLLLRRRRI